MSVSADEVIAKLDALVAATGFPPEDVEPELVLAAYQEIAGARATLIAEIAVLASAARGDERLKERCDALAARDRAWISAMSYAQGVVDQRIGAVRRAARYAR